MDNRIIKRHRVTNIVQIAILFVFMATLLALTGWVIAGLSGVKFALIIAAVSFLLSPEMSSRFIMRMYKAKSINPEMMPVLYDIIEVLSERAGLEKRPLLYVMPGPAINAFASGSRNDPAICLSEGLLRVLNTKEIAGILAHEITHIRNNDMKVMALAGMFNKITYYISLLGQIGLVLMLPVIWTNYTNLSLMPILLLVFAPTLSMLMQLALSRNREYEADLGSALLCGKPDYLVSALRKLEAYHKKMKYWFRIPGKMNNQNPWVSTHPPTVQRIKRLKSLSSANQSRDCRIVFG